MSLPPKKARKNCNLPANGKNLPKTLCGEGFGKLLYPVSILAMNKTYHT